MDIENAVNLDHRSLTYKNNERVSYRCVEGFTGSPYRTCTANGWSGRSMCTGSPGLMYLFCRLLMQMYIVLTLNCLFF